MKDEEVTCTVCGRKIEKLRDLTFYQKTVLHSEWKYVHMICAGKNIDDYVLGAWRKTSTHDQYPAVEWPQKWGMFPGCAHHLSDAKVSTLWRKLMSGEILPEEFYNHLDFKGENFLLRERTHKMSTICVIGAPCTGKTSVAQIFREYGLKVVEADDIVFKYDEKAPELFRALNYNMDDFVEQYPLVYLDMRKQWDEAVALADVVVTWPGWVKYFPFFATTVIAMIRDEDDWKDCISEERSPSLIDRIKERNPLEWVMEHSTYMGIEHESVKVYLLNLHIFEEAALEWNK